MKKLLLSLAAVCMAAAVNAQVLAFTTDDEGTAAGPYENGGFVLTCVNTSGKQQIDANSSYFGTAESYISFDHRFKTGGGSGEKNSMSLTIPSDGTLKVYVRTGSNGATNRTLVLTQNSTELYNAIVQESQAVKVMINDAEKSVYPVISVSVKEGTVDLAYTVGSLNFYGFEFVGGSTPVAGIEASDVVDVEYYNVAGVKVAEPVKGINIVKKTLSNGGVETSKVFVK